ncbi:hypothetical protein ACI8AF_27340 [Blastococcus sp. SYSU D00669]
MRALALVGWGLLVVAVAGWLALVEVFWLPLRVGGVLVPVSLVAAVVGNLLLVAAAHRLSGSRVVAVLPALVWGTVALAAAQRRPEGDLVLTGGGALGVLNLLFLLAGVVAAAFAVGRVLTMPPPRPAVPDAAEVQPAAER